MKYALITAILTTAAPACAWTTGNPQKDLVIEKTYQICINEWPAFGEPTSKDPVVECAKDAFAYANGVIKGKQP